MHLYAVTVADTRKMSAGTTMDSKLIMCIYINKNVLPCFFIYSCTSYSIIKALKAL